MSLTSLSSTWWVKLAKLIESRTYRTWHSNWYTLSLVDETRRDSTWLLFDYCWTCKMYEQWNMHFLHRSKHRVALKRDRKTLQKMYRGPLKFWVHHLVLGWITLDCIISIWFNMWSVAVWCGLTLDKLLHSYVVKPRPRCCTPMCVNQWLYHIVYII